MNSDSSYLTNPVSVFSEGLDLFREFLRTEFSEENIEFWIACEDYKNVHSNKLNNEAQRIYTDFIAVQAPHEVSVVNRCAIQVLRNAIGDGGCQISKKRYEDVWFNVISVTRGVGGCRISRKKTLRTTWMTPHVVLLRMNTWVPFIDIILLLHQI